MNKRSKLWAVLGASVMTLGIAGVALATDLNPGQVGITVGSKAGTDEQCAAFPLEIGTGEVGLHFVLTSAVEDSGLLSANFTNPVSSFSGLASTTKNGGTIHWYTVITGTSATVIAGASTDATGDNLNLSHSCAGAEETEVPSFEQSQEGETDAPSDVPSFEQSQEGATEPPTDGIGSTSAPSDGAWLLVAALGVLLASVVVLTPARARSRR